jgi:hypothetical protein
MDRRKFLGMMVGGVAAAAAVRTFPFRVFSFPKEITAEFYSVGGQNFFPVYSRSNGGLPDRYISFVPWREFDVNVQSFTGRMLHRDGSVT